MNQLWDEFEEFIAAAKLHPSDREAYLQSRCPTPDSCSKLLRLLSEGDRMPTTFMDMPPSALCDDDSMDLPEWIDDYEIIAEIGRGAMGVVLRGNDVSLRRTVAIKILVPSLALDVDSEGLVKWEGRMLAALRHPGIVEVHRLGKFEGGTYIAMQYVPGGTFKEWLGRLRQSGDPRAGGGAWTREQAEQILRVIAEVARALEYAHSAGVVHCDVKPSNILMDQHDHPVLTDFGVSQNDKAKGVRRGGTLAYMAPEYERGENPTGRADVYSLGLVLREALTGVCPAPAGVGGAPREPLPDVRERCPNAPAKIEKICRAATARDPDHRYPTAGHMALDLRACLEGEPLLVDNAVTRSVRRFARAHRRRITVAVFALLVLIAAGLTFLVESRRRARLAEWELTTIPAGLQVSIVPLTLVSGHEATTESKASPFAMRIEPGHYRVVAIAEGGRFAESTVYLARPGETQSTVLMLPGSSKPDDEVMAFIPAGTYELGDPRHDEPRGSRRVVLRAFYIDRAEVSNGEYLAFAEANNVPLPPHLTREFISADPAIADRPVSAISWYEANEYAAWVGKRLPSADEWECAMRYPDNRLVPWGNREPPELRIATLDDRDRAELNLSDWEEGLREYLIGTVPVLSEPQTASAMGLLHGGSNVAEYTSSINVHTNQVIIKGANWLRSPRYIDSTIIQTVPLTSGPQSLPARFLTTGFRCARSAQPPTP